MAEKPRGWYTAFYYFAEHIRILTNGAVNHKQVYSYVGEQSQYINNDNPAIRKSTAAALSRLMHSPKYAKEMQSRHEKDPEVFANAAVTLCQAIQNSGEYDTDGLYAYLRDIAWSDVETGLRNECDSGRGQVDVEQLDVEMATFLQQDLNSIFHLASSGAGPDPREVDSSVLAYARMGITPPRLCESVIATILYVMAYGSLGDEIARALTDKTPTASFEPIDDEPVNQPKRVCVVRLGDVRSYCIGGIWEVDSAEQFSIGRYADCSVVERDPRVSRLHCTIYREGDEWVLEDRDSSNGTQLVGKDGEVLYNSCTNESPKKTPIHVGERILLAGSVCYWFGAADGMQ